MKLLFVAVGAAILGRDRAPVLAPPVVRADSGLTVLSIGAEQPAILTPLTPPRVQAGLTVPGLIISGDGEHTDPRLELGDQYAVTASSGALVFTSPTAELFSVKEGKLHSQVPLSAGAIDVASLSIGGVPQWSLVVADNFAKSAEGWSHTSTSSCGGVTMLGGYCNFAQGDVTRTVSGLPPHSQLKIQATYHFIDRWVGETAFMKLNLGSGGEMVPVWTEGHAQDHEKAGLNVCGAESVHEGKFAVSVEVTVPHSSPDVNVAFGSTMDAQDPCDESWGISTFQVSVRP